MGDEEQRRRRLLLGIVLGLAVWGVILAVGAYLGLWHQAGEGAGLRDFRRFWVVLAAFAFFLSFWGAALAWRAHRNRPHRRHDA